MSVERCGHPDVGDICTRSQGHDGDHAGDIYSWPPNPWPGESDSALVTTEDERSAFWTGWLRMFIAWIAALVGGLLVIPVVHPVVICDLMEIATIFAGLQVGRLIWQAVAFWWED